MERWLILKIQSVLFHNPAAREIAVGMARWGFWAYILYGLVQWFRPGNLPQQIRRRQSMTEALFSVGISSFFSFLISLIWRRQRPFAAHGSVRQAVIHKNNASFPSNHTMNAAAAALTVFRYQKRSGKVLLIWSILIGASRIACGVHYVTDILGGMILGYMSSRIAGRSRLVRLVSFLVPVVLKIGRKR